LYLEVPEDGAWATAEDDVILRDITTPQQDCTLRLRARRGKPSTVAILRRRAKLAAHFKCDGLPPAFLVGDVMVVVRPEDSPDFWARVRLAEQQYWQRMQAAGESWCVFAEGHTWNTDTLWDKQARKSQQQQQQERWQQLAAARRAALCHYFAQTRSERASLAQPSACRKKTVAATGQQQLPVQRCL